MADFGGNPVKLMHAVGFSPAQMRNPNTYVSYTKLAELLEITSDACHEPFFGLLLSRRQTSTALGDIALTVAQKPTVKAALDGINQYMYLHARGIHVAQQVIGDYVRVQLAFEISSPRGLTQLCQLSVGQLENFLTELLALDEPTYLMQLRQRTVQGGSSALEQSVLSRIEFNAGADGVRVPSRWLARRSHRDQAALERHFLAYIQSLQQRYPDNLQDQVRDIVGRILPSGECRIERVAATLDLHPRVLQKRLQAQDTRYGKLLQETRRQIAEQHLRYSSMGVTDLALTLGYAEVSIFSRNFKQWTGLSPRHWQLAQR